jgi:glutamate synthase domain-containing protein 2/glutamate synthase domain-containing protein 1/glutamate synthase domain-containing protein 3
VSDRPTAKLSGLHDARYEHDACGVAFVARLTGEPTHTVIERALLALEHLEHRGASGADAQTGDGAGILVQLPDAFLRAQLTGHGIALPAAGAYGVAMCFLPRDERARARNEALVRSIVAAEGQRLLGWRDVPVDESACGPAARTVAPIVRQAIIAAQGALRGDPDAFERRLYVIRRLIEAEAGAHMAIPSLSARTIVYKGMLTAPQLSRFYPDLRDPRMASRLALVHSRFSTNTFPSWQLAHPYRMIAHNGEINTLRGNVNWMRAREGQLRSELFGDDLAKVLPVVREGGSDSATVDNVLELLVLAGRPLAHAVMMMIPEAHQARGEVSEAVAGFYAYHASVMEPWDGPAALAFTDGRDIGATLDRNGLRPGRWTLTDDGYVTLASEAGVLGSDPARIVRKGRLEPGKLFYIALGEGRIVSDAEIKERIATAAPYARWQEASAVHISDLPDRQPTAPPLDPLPVRQRAFGYTSEDLRVVVGPMARDGQEPTGSMGNDAALAVLSDRQPPLYGYFKQLFAQVTNPPIDPIRESVVMSLQIAVGAQGNLLSESAEHAHQLAMDQPILRNHELERLRGVDRALFHARTVDITWRVEDGPIGMERALQRICTRAERHITDDGASIIILSDRLVNARRAPVPALLAVAAVHHHLVRAGIRLRAGLVIESGEPREIHQMATLVGYGAAAINPYVLLETVGDLAVGGDLGEVTDPDLAESNTVKAIGKGLLKVMSKMGISTIESYCGAQIFEAVGLELGLVDRYFTGTPSRIGGVGLDVLAREALSRHARGYPDGRAEHSSLLPAGGLYQWRRDGERHIWNPDTVALLQHAVRGDADGGRTYAQWAGLVNEEATRTAALRGLLRLRCAREPIPLADVEPAAEIVKRFTTGAMSLGSLSREAHETLAVGMNRIGGRSNTGEGGEDPERFSDERRSAIKQVASARFGVDIDYLVNADVLQIKMAQGAKPGEGGQLPGHKVDAYIARLRHATPGVGLISPPPHHDIYSIEDLKQLIYDLRCANPAARVSVKLVSEVGVGTVAAGVAKANADHVTISGHGGGTGASPQSSIQSAGVPWELGLAETQQTLLANDLRSRITVEVDGQVKTGRDVVVGALLGADAFGFSTAPLVAMGCVLMRVCHLNTCPVGIATQDPELRKRFAGTPEHVISYFLFVAEEVRGLMARLGIARFDELIGRADLLHADEAIDHWKARGVDLSQILAFDELTPGTPRHRVRPPAPVLDDALDWRLISECAAAIEHGRPTALEHELSNVNRTVGGLLSGRIAKQRGAAGLPEGTIRAEFHGSAGQSFGAWLAPGVTFTLMGEANDYAGKGLSGGIVAIRPPDRAGFCAEENVIVGNTALYGATAGRAFFRGIAGQRFAVRNSGAVAVVEGVGDHGCEYMTGGRVAILGPAGRNFAAGMSGGIAYVLDAYGHFGTRVNRELVDLCELDASDARELHGMIAEHARRTRSPVAFTLLSSWDTAQRRFVKVMPRDYRRALRGQAVAAQDAVAVTG